MELLQKHKAILSLVTNKGPAHYMYMSVYQCAAALNSLAMSGVVLQGRDVILHCGPHAAHLDQNRPLSVSSI